MSLPPAFPTLNDLAEILYIESYPPDANVERIQPLAERAQWEIDLWRRVALKATETLSAAVQAEVTRRGRTT